ncbi:hypothetical protein IAT40_003799 [Kwoniella sp. CBS 6097]
MPNSDSDSEPEDEGLKAQGKVIIVVEPHAPGMRATFCLKWTVSFQKLFTGYEKICKIDKNSRKYLYNENVLITDSTPKMMEWKPGRKYEVEAWFPSEGGTRLISK